MQQLEQFLKQRLKRGPRIGLEQMANQLIEGLNFHQYFLPEEFSFGFNSSVYHKLNTKQQLCLNHWSYYLFYQRLNQGESFGVTTNKALSNLFKYFNPKLSQYFLMENLEEIDHIQGFGKIKKAIEDYYQIEHKIIPTRHRFSLIKKPKLLQSIVDFYGPLFITYYFLARGLGNHIGAAIESKPIVFKQNLGHLASRHNKDETLHTKISYEMTKLSQDQLFKNSHIKLKRYLTFEKLLSKSIIEKTFNDLEIRQHYKKVFKKIIKECSVFFSLELDLKQQLIKDITQDHNELETIKNSYCPQKNLDMLRMSSLSTEAKYYWIEQLKKQEYITQYLPH